MKAFIQAQLTEKKTLTAKQTASCLSARHNYGSTTYEPIKLD
jgi:hypothetical protein